jgi:hypothetical protein
VVALHPYFSVFHIDLTALLWKLSLSLSVPLALNLKPCMDSCLLNMLMTQRTSFQCHQISAIGDPGKWSTFGVFLLMFLACIITTVKSHEHCMSCVHVLNLWHAGHTDQPHLPLNAKLTLKTTPATIYLMSQVKSKCPTCQCCPVARIFSNTSWMAVHCYGKKSLQYSVS